MNKISFLKHVKCKTDKPTLGLSLTPIIVLVTSLVSLIIADGAEKAQTYGWCTLLGSAAVCLILTRTRTNVSWQDIAQGIKRSGSQILPAVPILALIGTLSATWMLSGVVPTLIDYGLILLNPTIFLAMACIVCAVVSVMTGSSWTTLATIGVAFMGIGTVMGYSQAWVAGAVISGAYFGDKISPLSDTTVLAASSCGIDLFSHIRFLMFTTIPAMTIALIVYGIVGFTTPTITETAASAMTGRLQEAFNITPLLLIIPGITALMIALRMRTDLILLVSSLLGLAGIFVFQPQIASALTAESGNALAMSARVLFSSTSLNTGDEMLDSLVATGGMAGMLPTIYLVLSAMSFGGLMLGSGMIATITRAITSRLHTPKHLVSTTVASGLFLNSCTGDQYLSIIIGGNVYRDTYGRLGLRPQVLSRSLEDSISVTSVLIPWNSCGVTQSTVLGVATLTYLPCCIFNILSPLMSIVLAWSGWRIRLPQQNVCRVSPQ